MTALTHPLRIRLSFAVEVDVEDWVAEYGTPLEEVCSDVLTWARTTLNESVAPARVVSQ